MNSELPFTVAVVKAGMGADAELQERLPRAVEITDGQRLKQLVQALPGAGTNRESRTAGGWVPGLVIHLRRSDGTTTIVRIHPEFKYWTEGNGDWPLSPEFRLTLDDLLDASSPSN